MSEKKKLAKNMDSRPLAEPALVPLASAFEGVRRVVLPTLRGEIIKRFTDAHIESLMVGGPEDPFELLKEGGCHQKLAFNHCYVAFQWFLGGAGAALQISAEEVLESVSAYVPVDYPFPVRRWINGRRSRLGLSPYTDKKPSGNC